MEKDRCKKHYTVSYHTTQVTLCYPFLGSNFNTLLILLIYFVCPLMLLLFISASFIDNYLPMQRVYIKKKSLGIVCIFEYLILAWKESFVLLGLQGKYRMKRRRYSKKKMNFQKYYPYRKYFLKGIVVKKKIILCCREVYFEHII